VESFWGALKKFAAIVAGDGGDISQGSGGVFVLDDVQSSPSVLQCGPVGHASTAKIFLKFEGVDTFYKTRAGVGHRLHGDRGKVRVRVLHMVSRFLEGRQAGVLHGAESEMIACADGILAGVLGGVSPRIEIVGVSIRRDSLTGYRAIGGVVDLDLESGVGKKTSRRIGDEGATGCRSSMDPA
jgi:hypothetical protein